MKDWSGVQYEEQFEEYEQYVVAAGRQEATSGGGDEGSEGEGEDEDEEVGEQDDMPPVQESGPEPSHASTQITSNSEPPPRLVRRRRM